jgi:hypothetical protein
MAIGGTTTCVPSVNVASAEDHSSCQRSSDTLLSLLSTTEGYRQSHIFHSWSFLHRDKVSLEEATGDSLAQCWSAS